MSNIDATHEVHVLRFYCDECLIALTAWPVPDHRCEHEDNPEDWPNGCACDCQAELQGKKAARRQSRPDDIT